MQYTLNIYLESVGKEFMFVASDGDKFVVQGRNLEELLDRCNKSLLFKIENQE